MVDPLIAKSRWGYQALAEIVRVRDAIEHPKLGNVHQGGDADWDRCR